MCGLTCTVDQGPFSPMREGSADNIYVIPAPHIITFGAATLIAAASCIPAILSMVSMWDKIVKINWKERFGYPDDPVDPNELIEGTNATVGKMNKVNEKIREFLSVVEVPLFGGAVLALIVVGELNFWSRPVEYQTEPIANIGKQHNWYNMPGIADSRISSQASGDPSLHPSWRHADLSTC